MKSTIFPVSFFFGVNNKSGYCSLFGDIYDPYEKGEHIILKGGPGTGKSTLMKRVAKTLEGKGCFVERGFCSADPSSLDVVIAPEINFSIIDGTAPHTFDPKMTGISEHIVDLGVAWDRKKLQTHIYEIGQLMQSNALQHKRASEFLHVASQIEKESAGICGSFTDTIKLERFVKRIANREIPARKAVKQGRRIKRFLSAVSPVGMSVQHETVVALCERIITLEDEFSAVSPFVAAYLSNYARGNGYDVIECFCPIFPTTKIEHLIIPELKLAFFTQNSYHSAIDGGEKTVHATRFYDKDGFARNREKLNIQKKAKRELIDEAVRKLALAKDIHDKLEAYYIEATDFGVINEIGEKILNSIK